MRTIVAFAALALALCLAAVAGAGSGVTELRIRVWPEGTDGASRVWTLRCSPPGGTLPRPARACRVLAGLDDPFAPVPKDAVCAAIYGGPQVARVTGAFRGRNIWATFQRRDGCEIGRWGRVAVLFPVAVQPT